VIECGEVEPLRRDKHARYEVAASARNPERRVVATGASIGVLRRHAVEVSRKDQGCGRICERRSRASRHWSSAAFLRCPVGNESGTAPRDELPDGHGVLFAVLEPLISRRFLSDLGVGDGAGQEQPRQ